MERGILIRKEIKYNKDVVKKNVNLIVQELKRSDKAIFSKLETLYTGTLPKTPLNSCPKFIKQ